MFWAYVTAQHPNYSSDDMDLYICLESKNCVPSKRVNFTVKKKNHKKLNFSSGFCQFAL